MSVLPHHTNSLVVASLLTIGMAAFTGHTAAAVPAAHVGARPPAAAVPAKSTNALIYVKNGLVWKARADGSHAKVFLHHRNDWQSPSIDDHGRVVVLGGKPRTNADGSDSSGASEIYRFSPTGHRLGSPIPTWGSRSTPACPTYGPYTARVSPDGSKVAYGIFECGDDSQTTLWTPITSKGLAFPHQHLGQDDFVDPQWVNSRQFVASHAGSQFGNSSQWFVHNTSGKDYSGAGWYEPSLSDYQVHALISRDGSRMAVFAEDGYAYTNRHPRHLLLYLYTRPAGSGSGWHFNWDKRCTVTLSAAHLSDPTHLSPSFTTNGLRLYWADQRGVESVPFTASCARVKAHLVVPGGSDPYVG
jgi:hypothetical protein